MTLNEYVVWFGPEPLDPVAAYVVRCAGPLRKAISHACGGLGPADWADVLQAALLGVVEGVRASPPGPLSVEWDRRVLNSADRSASRAAWAIKSFNARRVEEEEADEWAVTTFTEGD